MAGGNTPKFDVNAALPLIEGVVLDIMGLVRRRQAEGKQPPTDAEVIARAKAKAMSIVDEAAGALAEFPEERDTGG